ncbi:S1 RNA-binding domain-containing protein [Streptomyces shenzhenensis]|uniref:S1 RNA-binding domain-containing protein n=1 Tax=Streptomyces shenzhenensis TaxID=943815 RepID=UPI00382D6AE4
MSERVGYARCRLDKRSPSVAPLSTASSNATGMQRRVRPPAGSDVLPYVYRVTKYDPTDRDQHGCYAGIEPAISDHGPAEAAYLLAVAAFAEETGIDRPAVREPQISGFARFGLKPPVGGYGLAGLFPGGLAGFHDGALVSIAAGLELVGAMLRDSGAWCRLEMEGAFAVHVGWDQYLYVGSSLPCEAALARTRSLGLFPERLDASPYDFAPDDPLHEQRPADAGFWARLRWTVNAHRATFLEETFAANASRWHRLTRDNIETVRSQLTPRARLAVWPDLLTDIDATMASLPDEGLVEIIWEDEDGQITSTVTDETQFEAVTSQLTGARAGGVVSLAADERHPLFTAVLPDSDGVLRARRQTEPTPSDRDWAFLKTLRRGQIVTGTATAIAGFGVTFVDIGGFTAVINIPELSWRPINHPSEWPQVAQRIGQVVTGPVTKVVPFGVFVRIEDREDGFEGLMHTSELDESPGDVVEVGDALAVKIIDVDLARRRIALSQTQARTPRHEGDRHS